MFLKFYGFSEQPFGVTPDPRFLYMGPAQQEAFSSLVYGIETGRGFMALIASPGLGKTTILLKLMERLRESARTALLFHTHANPLSFCGVSWPILILSLRAAIWGSCSASLETC